MSTLAFHAERLHAIAELIPRTHENLNAEYVLSAI